MAIMSLMAIGYLVSTAGFGTLMIAPAVFAASNVNPYSYQFGIRHTF